MRASLERLRDLTDKDTLAHLRTAWTRIGIRTGDAKAGGDGVRSSLDNLLQGKQYRDYAAKFVNSDLLQPDEARKTFRVRVPYSRVALSHIFDLTYSLHPHK